MCCCCFLRVRAKPAAACTLFSEIDTWSWNTPQKKIDLKFKKEICPHSSEPVRAHQHLVFVWLRPGRDCTSPIKINLKLIMASSEGPDGSCLHALQTHALFFFFSCPRCFESRAQQREGMTCEHKTREWTSAHGPVFFVQEQQSDEKFLTTVTSKI